MFIHSLLFIFYIIENILFFFLQFSTCLLCVNWFSTAILEFIRRLSDGQVCGKRKRSLELLNDLLCMLIEVALNSVCGCPFYNDHSIFSTKRWTKTSIAVCMIIVWNIPKYYWKMTWLCRNHTWARIWSLWGFVF